jgi:threonine synthase
MIGVQARACAPLWALSSKSDHQVVSVTEGDSLAEGVRVRDPLRAKVVCEAVATSRGFICAIDEKDILPARDALARLGFYVEPTSAIAWAALLRVMDKLPDPIVVILTGSGLKYG